MLRYTKNVDELLSDNWTKDLKDGLIDLKALDHAFEKDYKITKLMEIREGEK